MAARTFPLALLGPGTFQVWPVAMMIGGGASLAGPGQSVDWSGGGWWSGELGAIRVSKPDQHRALRALLMHAASGGEVIMPIIDTPQRPMVDPSLGPAAARFSDGAGFADGTSFLSGRIAFELAEDAAEGDTVLKLRRVEGRRLLGGEYWSFNHPDAGERAYCIEDLGAETTGQVTEVAFGVPLRTDLKAGAAADFEYPRVVMRLSSDPKDVWPVIRPPFRSDVTIRFIESFDYL